MSASNGRKTSSTNKKTAAGKARGGNTTRKRKADASAALQESALFHEIGLIVLFVVMVLLFFCNFGWIGPVGDSISGVLFGLFGFPAYAVPVLIFLAVAFWFANEGNPNVARKLAAGAVLFIMLGIVCDLLSAHTGETEGYNAVFIYENCRNTKSGGGLLAGSIGYFLKHYLETIGTVLVVLLCTVVSFILLTEKSLIGGMKKGGSRVRELSSKEAQRRRELAEIRRQEQEEQDIRRRERAEIRRREQEEQDIRRRERAEIRRQEQEEQGQRRREQAEIRRQEQEAQRARKAEERRLKAEEKENEKILRMERKVSGVMLDTSLAKEAGRRDDIHEIVLTQEELGGPEDCISEEYFPEEYAVGEYVPKEEMPAGQETEYAAGFPETGEEADFAFESIPVREVHQVILNEEPEEPFPEYVPEDEAVYAEEEYRQPQDGPVQEIRIHKEEAEGMPEPVRTEPVQASGELFRDGGTRPFGETGPGAAFPAGPETEPAGEAQGAEAVKPEGAAPKPYMLPPISLLQKGAAVTGDSARELKETAMHLQQTLATFGVKVTITDISQGPSVTRYEMQPEQGVKVSKIVGLADDIKLNLAATDIRIEAPIPGKAAVGIEVPNKETMPVSLRDLLETRDFKEFQSNLTFAVGKDIAGKVVVADIAKMPHMLIAGATGSGKSVCINTLIMSILYKAHPDDVKLIMVDPKVVELSVYNGIPHLLVPVVTDPKKASAALHWGVAEMDDRYRKFAEYNVRDLKGYNKKVEAMREKGQEDAPKKLPQIVIIVDELADLMMVCPGEVEESICRLAQLARAAGIHLIIATQRPSVDVITGLIKANMPSRVAFSVSSGVDSRTILDMVGAEKLLGKGDMLFYPQGYAKPARVQGAFVSDQEVSDVVDFLKNQVLGNTYAADVEEKITNIGSVSGGGKSSGGSDVDELFEKAGRLIIDKDKASIGMLQRALQIGFNRAARIMDQLCIYGVVGEEEGTKPRKILMSPEQFDQLMEEVV